MLIPFICPGTVWALGQVYCFGAGGLVERVFGSWWTVMAARINPGNYLSTGLVLAQVHAPICMLVVARGCQRLGHSGWLAAEHYLSKPRLIAWICGALRAELGTAFVLAFSFSLGNFAVPHVLQCRLYSIEVYMRTVNYLDRAGAIVASAPLIALSLAAAAIFARHAPAAGSSTAASRRRGGRGSRRLRLGFAGALLTYLVLVCGLPMAALMAECKSIGHFVAAARTAVPELRNTLLIAASAAALTVTAGGLAAWVRWPRGRFVWQFANLLPIALPPLVIALAVARFGSLFGARSTSIALAGSLLVYALVLRAWPFAFRAVQLGAEGASPAWREAAIMAHMPRWKRWGWIDAPQAAPHLMAAATITFVLAVGEVEMSQLLCAPGYGTLALRLFTFLHFGPTHVAASLAVLEVLLVVVPVCLYSLVANRRLQIL
jgi:ABC-type Fe3+ transport system permease subunit